MPVPSYEIGGTIGVVKGRGLGAAWAALKRSEVPTPRNGPRRPREALSCLRPRRGGATQETLRWRVGAEDAPGVSCGGLDPLRVSEGVSLLPLFHYPKASQRDPFLSLSRPFSPFFVFFSSLPSLLCSPRRPSLRPPSCSFL